MVRGLAAAPLRRHLQASSTPPREHQGCSKVFIEESFDSYTPGADFSADFRYTASPLLPMRLFTSYIQAAAGGYLQINIPGRDDSCAVLDPIVFHMNNPAWQDAGVTTPDYVDVRAKVMLSTINARAGVAARVYETGKTTSYYALSIAHNTRGASLTKVIQGAAPVSLGNTLMSTFNPQLNVFYSVSIVVAKSSIKAYINGTLAFDTSDSDIPYGSGGLYAENGLNLYDDFVVSGACESSGTARPPRASPAATSARTATPSWATLRSRATPTAPTSAAPPSASPPRPICSRPPLSSPRTPPRASSSESSTPPPRARAAR
jgi:hypothetical protein